MLAQARESMLFSYDSLTMQREIAEVGYDDFTPGVEDTEALRGERDVLDKLAYMVENRTIRGVSVPKKPDYDAPKEQFISSFYGMLGIPIDPAVELDGSAKSVILGPQAAGFHGVRDYIIEMSENGAAVVCTKGFEELTGYHSADGVPVIDRRASGKLDALHTDADNWNIVDMPEDELNALRDYLMKPLGLTLRGPSRVGLTLYDDDMEVVQNFNDFEVEITLDLFGRSRKARRIELTLPENSGATMKREGSVYTLRIPARTYVVL